MRLSRDAGPVPRASTATVVPDRELSSVRTTSRPGEAAAVRARSGRADGRIAPDTLSRLLERHGRTLGAEVGITLRDKSAPLSRLIVTAH